MSNGSENKSDIPQAAPLPATVWILGIASLLNDVSTEIIHSVLPLYMVTALGASFIAVGLLEGTAEALASVLKVGAGGLSDLLGKRKALVVSGYALSTLVKGCYALAGDMTMVMIARLGDRVGKGIRVGPRDALVADSTSPEQRGAAYGLRQSLDTVGAVIGPGLSFVLLSLWHMDYKNIFAIAIVPGIIAVLLLLIGVREPEKRESKSDDKKLHKDLLKRLSPAYWSLVVVSFLFNLGNSSDAFILLKGKEAGLALGMVPLMLVVMNVFYAACAYPAGKLSDKLGRVAMLRVGLLFYALVYLGFAFCNTQWQVWTLMALYGVQLGLTQGTLLALVSDVTDADTRGTAFGMISLVTGLALLPASLIAGFLWQNVGSWATFGAGTVCSVVALIVFSIWYRPEAG